MITLCQDRQERERFLEILATALSAYPKQFHLLITLRSDFEPQFRNTPLEPYWTSSRFIVPEMGREELREAIEEPAYKRVIFFEPHNLVGQLIDEVVNMPGALPLLSFALSELYLKYLHRQEQAKLRGNTIERAITLSDYHELGGVTRSLTQRADWEYHALVNQDSTYAQTIRNVMLPMVAVGGELARRKVPESELNYPEPENTRVKRVIQQFLNSRLIVVGTDANHSTYFEPAHDALVRGWEKLLIWQKQAEEQLTLQRRLTQAALEWESLKTQNNDEQTPIFKRADRVLNWLDGQLSTIESLVNQISEQVVRRWQQTPDQQGRWREKSVQFLWNANPYLEVLNETLNSNDNWFNEVEAEFVQKSIQKKRQNVSWRRRIAIGVILSLSGLTTAALLYQRGSQIREARTLRSSAEINLADNQSLDSMVEILQAGNTLKNPLLKLFPPNSQLQRKIEGTLQTAIYTVRERNRLQGHERPVRSVVHSPDGRQLATSGDDGKVRLWNLPGEKLQEFGEQGGSIRSVQYSPQGQLLVTVGDNGLIGLWTLQGQLVKQWNTKQGKLQDVQFDPDGELVVSAADNGTIRLWNLQGELLREFKGHLNSVKSLSFHPNGQYIASASDDGTVRLWNLQGEELKTVISSQKPLTSLCFSPDGQFLVGTGEDSIVRVWSIKGKQASIIKEWNTKQGKLWDVQFTSDGQQIAIAGGDGTVRVLNLQGQELEKFVGHKGPVRSVSLSPDDRQLASSSDDTMVRIWNLQPVEFISREFDRSEPKRYTRNVSLSPDGKKKVVGNKDGIIGLYDSQDRLFKKFEGHLGKVNSVAFSSNSEKIVSGGEDGTIRVWNLDGKSIRIFQIYGPEVSSVMFSPDSQ
ncbi:WD40 repeat domain-containing protein [Capilliphycus salinus ALCB114379]|uniref:WD40 repeat domain-containing protein n=1 Tax=Capilliphycus salinus TaxID=2768948 RepID=UPI0039A4F71C